MLTTLTAIVFLSAHTTLPVRVEAVYEEQIAVLSSDGVIQTNGDRYIPTSLRSACVIFTSVGIKTIFLTYLYDIESMGWKTG